MSEVMDRLREEHRNLEKILRALEHQITIFDKAEQPDYDVLATVADYFLSFPERCHHPKEDLIFRKMCDRDPTLAQTMTDLEAEHEKLSVLARHFQEAVRNVMQEVEVPRSVFSNVTRNFLSEQRRHIEAEEDRFFPLALQILTPDDWAEIDKRITRDKDPVFGDEISQEFELLRDTILKWEREDEALER